MGMFRAIADFVARQFAPRRPSAPISASYDAAQTTRHNQNHWSAADNLSANASQTQGLRRVMRNRSRYEAGSNPLYQGVLRTMADHTLGTGPRIQFLDRDPGLNAALWDLWHPWWGASAMDDKLWVLKETQVRDGEAFLLQIGNPGLQTEIQLDYQLLEGDYVTSLRPQWTPWQVDGITYDPQWNPLSYQIVTQRPNDVLPIVWPQQHKVDAKYVIHYFRQERPAQGRGIPELLSAFELLAVLRRYIAATVSAAEVAASFAAFIKTNGAPVVDTQGQEASSDAWLTLEIQRNLITMLPEGYDISQLKPEQPTQSFTEFVRTVITLLTRCLSMPLNIAMCDSSGYNFSSSRLDHQTYFKAIDIDRCNRLEKKVLKRILADFYDEAAFVMSVPRARLAQVPHEWHWDPPISVDPQKETDAARGQVEAGLKSLPDMQKQGNVGGDVVKENAEYFGVSEDEMRRAMFEKLFKSSGAKPAPQNETGVEDDAPQPKSGTAARAASSALACAAPANDIRGARVPAELQIAAAAEGDDAVPRFRMVAYSGGPMRLEGHEYPVIVDLATCIAASESTPILYEHDPEREVGHAPQLKIDAAGITVPEGYFSGASPERDKVVTAARRKYPWQASIGGRAEHIDLIPEGESVTLNGRTFPGPVEAAYGVRVREISILSIGADASTSAVLAAKAAQSGAVVMGFEEWVRSLGFDAAALSEPQKQALMNEWQSKQADAQAGEPGDGERETTAAGDDDEGDGEEDTQTEAADEDSEEDDDRTPPAKTKAAAGKQATSTRGKPAKTRTLTASAPKKRKPTMGNDLKESRRIEAAEMRRVHAIRKAAGDDVELAAKAIEEGWPSDKVELTVLRARRPQGVMAGPVSRGNGGEPDYNAVVECSLLMASGVSESRLAALDKRRYCEAVIDAACCSDSRGYTLTRVVQEFLQAHGRPFRNGRLDENTIRAALDLSNHLRATGQEMNIQASDGFTTASLSGILSNLLNKTLLVSFIAVPTASQDFCGAQDLNDFKLASRYRLSMNGTLQKVGPTGELKSTTMQDETWTNQLDTYGTLLTLNRQMLINDDLDALLQLPRLLGRQSSLAVEEAVFTVLLANANQSDGQPFFSAAHNNIKTGGTSALSVQSLTDAVTLFLKQTDAAGKPIVLAPAAMLVPPENKVLADQLFKDTNVVALLGTSTASGKLVPQSNPHSGKYRPVSSPYLSNGLLANNSATGWYLLADPADVPMISIGYLRGQRTPTIDQGQTDMDVLGFRWRCYFDFGIGQVDWRAGVFSAGA